MKPDTTRTRAVVLMAVMISVAMIASAASIVLLRADAQVTGTAAVLRHSQSRAAALSGVRAALAELQGQRAKLLQGGTPELTGNWTLAEAGQNAGLTIRLVDLGPTEGILLQPEAAKINLNSVAGGMVKRASEVIGLSQERLGAIKERGAIGSLSELGRVGVSLDRVYGRVLSPESVSAGSALAAGSGTNPKDPDGASTGAVAAGVAPATGISAMNSALADVCTVYSADPNVQVGISGAGTTYGGMPRINLGLGWSEDLVEPITKRFGKDAVETTRQLLKGGGEIKSMKDVVGVLRRLGVPNRQWGSLLDSFTTSADPFVIGRVDLLRAPASVLSTIPGIDEAAAERIVAVRDRLDEAARREVTWPVLEGILSVEQFESAVDSLTCRTLQWRVIVEAGRPRRAVSGTTQGAGELMDRVVLEAVLDVAGSSPRIAYLRDVTSLQAVRTIHAARRAAAASGAAGVQGAEARQEAAELPGLVDPLDAGMLEPVASGTDPGGDSGAWSDSMRGEADLEGALGGGDGGGGEGDMAGVQRAGGMAGAQAAGGMQAVRGVDNRTGRWNAHRAPGGVR